MALFSAKLTYQHFLVHIFLKCIENLAFMFSTTVRFFLIHSALLSIPFLSFPTFVMLYSLF